MSRIDVRGGTKLKIRNLNATVQAVKAGPGVLYGIFVTNVSGATCYVQIFDVAAASVTLGTTTPDIEITLATAQSQFFPFGPGAGFGTAIAIASTTTEAGAVGSANGVHVSPLFG